MLIAIGVTVFLSFYNFPKRVDISYPAVEFELGDSKIDKTTVKINGILKRPLFRSHTFEGHVMVDKYQLSEENVETKQFEMGKEKGVYSFSTPPESNWDDGILVLSEEEFSTTVWTDKAFENFVFYVNANESDNAHLSAPAITYEEAVQIYKTIFKK